MELSDYANLIKRRLLWFVVPLVITASIATAVAFVLPTIFRSEATFIIQRQTIPENIIATTVTGYVQEQIEVIRQRIVTYDNLTRLAETNDLSPELLATDPSEVVSELRSRISVAMSSVKSTDPVKGGERVATVSFVLAVEAENPSMAQRLTSQLSERFLAENRENREERASTVTGFLQDEADRLQDEIKDLERQLAGFKQEELQQLPELMSMNLNLFERTQGQIDQVDIEIRGLKQTINAVSAELSLTEPYDQVRSEDGGVILTGAQRLSALTAEYLKASARYSSEHPDIKRLSREIRLLSEENGSNLRIDEIMDNLVTMQEQLRQARQKYDDSHPEVASLEASIASLQRGMQTVIVDAKNNADLAIPPDNPRYVALQTQLSSAEINLQASLERRDELKSKLAEYEERLFNTPLVERDYLSLSRGYANAVGKFQELKDKQLQARLAQELESGDNAQQFILASAAYLPKLPESPNRIGIALLGVFIGLLLGTATVIVVEYMDKTIRGRRMVYNVVGVLPLASIPQLDPQ